VTAHETRRVVAVLACRAESTRLYGKPMQLVGDRPILRHLVDRLEQVRGIDQIALAISDSPSHGVFEAFAKQHGLGCTIGPERDVLGRLIACAEAFGAGTVVRVTTENPFVYWENLDALLALHAETAATLTVTDDLPVGAAIEVVSLDGWREAHRHGNQRQRTQAPAEYFTAHPDRFRINRVPAPKAAAAPDLRLTVDSPEDLMLVRAVWQALESGNRLIALEEIVAFLRSRPEVAAVNAHLRAPYLWHSPGTPGSGA
jgi:spore coat polysaccharide biosynthesis protein SpsF